MIDGNNGNISRDKSCNNSNKPRTLNKLHDYNSKESSQQDVKTLNLVQKRESRRNYYINRDLNSTGYRTRPVSKDSRRNQTFYKRTSPSVDMERRNGRIDQDEFFRNNDSLGTSSLKNSLPWMTQQSKPAQSFRTSFRSKVSKNNGSKEYLMKEKIGRLENLNKGYKVLLMSMSMTKDAIKQNQAPTNPNVLPTSPTEITKHSAKDGQMIERSYSVQGDNNNNHIEKEINQKITILKKRQRNYDNLFDKLSKVIYDNFSNICSLSKTKLGSDQALNFSKGVKNSDVYSSKKVVSDQVKQFESNLNVGSNFGTYTIAKILENRDLYFDLTIQGSEKSLAPEELELKKKKY